jgi:uncharacterized protein YcbX
MSDLSITLAELFVHPIKACGALAVNDSTLLPTGLEWDREWMLVDPDGQFVTQRELPRLALVSPKLRHADLMLRAPGMLALHLSLDTVETACRVKVWDDELPAWDMGALAAQWFSDFAGRPLRLVRFDPDAERVADARWTGEQKAGALFADAFPLLVLSRASIAGLNERLARQGHAPVDARRFRPNLLLDGLDPHGEDFLEEIAFDTLDGPVRIRPVKPCTRCSVPDVDPDRADTGHAVGDALAAYRADARVKGAITFGMNAIVVEGDGARLRAGQAGTARIAF